MTAHRPFKVFAVIAAIAAVALCVAAWLLSRQARELMDATSAANAAQMALEQEQAQLQQAALELSQSAQQAQQQASALQASIENSQQHQQDQVQLERRMRELRAGLTAASSVKTAMAEHFMSMGSWPASNQELGAPAPGSYKTQTLRSVAVEAGGKIELLFDRGGSKEHLLLHASANPAGQINWRCTSPDIVDIARLVAECAYE